MLRAARNAGEPVTAAWSLPELELEGLDRKAAGTLLGQATRGRPGAPHVQEQLLALAGGTPGAAAGERPAPGGGGGYPGAPPGGPCRAARRPGGGPGAVNGAAAG